MPRPAGTCRAGFYCQKAEDALPGKHRVRFYICWGRIPFHAAVCRNNKNNVEVPKENAEQHDNEHARAIIMKTQRACPVNLKCRDGICVANRKGEVPCNPRGIEYNLKCRDGICVANRKGEVPCNPRGIEYNLKCRDGICVANHKGEVPCNPRGIEYNLKCRDGICVANHKGEVPYNPRGIELRSALKWEGSPLFKDLDSIRNATIRNLSFQQRGIMISSGAAMGGNSRFNKEENGYQERAPQWEGTFFLFIHDES